MSRQLPSHPEGIYGLELLTVAEIAAVLKVPAAWVYERVLMQIVHRPRIEWLLERIANGFEAREGGGIVFGSAFRSRGDHSVRALVSAL